MWNSNQLITEISRAIFRYSLGMYDSKYLSKMVKSKRSLLVGAGGRRMVMPCQCRRVLRNAARYWQDRTHLFELEMQK